MIERIKIILIAIIVVLSFGFSIVSLETVPLDDGDIHYCRKLEFWCGRKWSNPVYYSIKEDKYYSNYTLEFTDFTVKSGKFYYQEENQEYTTNLADGEYSNVTGMINWGPSDELPDFLVLNDDMIYIGKEE